MKARTIKSLALLVIVAAIAIGTMSLAWPRLQASLTYLPVDTAINNYYKNQQIPNQQIPELITRAEQAIQEHDHYRYHEGLSLLHYLYGIDARSPTMETRPALEKSLAEAETAVSAAPAQPMIWQRMALIHALLRHSPERVIQSLNMSVYTGRVEPTLLISRLELGSRYLEWMDTEAQGLLRDQALLTWKLQAGHLTKAIKEQRINWPAMQLLLADRNAGVLNQMEASLGPVQ